MVNELCVISACLTQGSSQKNAVHHAGDGAFRDAEPGKLGPDRMGGEIVANAESHLTGGRRVRVCNCSFCFQVYQGRFRLKRKSSRLFPLRTVRVVFLVSNTTTAECSKKSHM